MDCKVILSPRAIQDLREIVRYISFHHPQAAGRLVTPAQERIEQFQQWLVQMRRTAGPEESDAVASGYRLEIERIQAEVMEYLLHPPFIEPHLQSA